MAKGGLTPREWDLITDQIMNLSEKAEIAKAKTRVETARRELAKAKEELADARRRWAGRGRILVKPAGNPSVPVEKIREVVRKHK